jgi:hypothetical protein
MILLPISPMPTTPTSISAGFVFKISMIFIKGFLNKHGLGY